MKLLVVGSGGREHAIAKKLLESKDVEQVFVAPGNDGMTLDGLDLINIGISEHSKLIDFAKANDIAWTFIGPDDALAAGIVDDFNAAGLKAFGPTKAAAELEWSKDFAKEIMVKYDVPTAAYGTFSDFEEAKAYIEEKGAPIVVKADGLALGKGVVVAETVEQAVEAAHEMLLDNKFGDSGARVVIEEFLDGEEFSLFAFVNGDKFYIMPTAQDHKRAYDGDKGPNTGGMGAYAPVPHLPQSVVDTAVDTIVKPVLEGMIKEAKTNIGEHSNIHYAVVNVEELPYEDERFNIVIANMMLYHIPNLDKALSEIRRVLKKNGIFYCATYGENGVESFINQMLNVQTERQHTFTLQNGEGILEDWFSDVEKLEYDDKLLISNYFDLVEYIQSFKEMNDWQNYSKEELYRLISDYEKQGVIEIPKEYGMFVSRK